MEPPLPQEEINKYKPVEDNTVTQDRLLEVIRNTEMQLDATKRVLTFLAQHPEMDADFAKVFGISRAPKIIQPK